MLSKGTNASSGSGHITFRGVSNFLRVNRVAVFKSGYGLVTEEINFPLDKTVIEIPAPSHILHGSLWIQPSDQIEIESTKTVTGQVGNHENCTSMLQLLQANLDQVVEVQLDGKDWVSGRIDSVLPEETQTTSATGEPVPVPSSSKGIVVLDYVSSKHALPTTRVTNIKMPLHPPREFQSGGEIDQVLQTRLTKYSPVLNLRIHYKVKGEKKGSSTAVMNFLTRGVAWSPSYKLVVKPGEPTAHLSMNCTLMNDAEDFFVDEFVCVSGSPVMNFTDSIDPLANRQKIPLLLKAIREGEYTYTDRSAPTQISQLTKDGKPTVFRSRPHDLVQYTLKDISLRKNDRMSVPSFAADVPMAEIYSCDIGGKNDIQRVWQGLKLENTSGFAWASGCILVLEEKALFAHTRIPYVAKNDSTIINLNQVMDIKVLYSVSEKDSGEESIADKKYVLQRNTATVYVTNEKAEPIVISLSAKFAGEIKDSAGGKISSELNRLDINPTGSITWEVSVQPGETKNVTYNCVYRRSR